MRSLINVKLLTLINSILIIIIRLQIKKIIGRSRNIGMTVNRGTLKNLISGFSFHRRQSRVTIFVSLKNFIDFLVRNWTKLPQDDLHPLRLLFGLLMLMSRDFH